MAPPATVLMVAEKPSLAKSIAEFLSEGRVRCCCRHVSGRLCLFPAACCFCSANARCTEHSVHAVHT